MPSRRRVSRWVSAASALLVASSLSYSQESLDKLRDKLDRAPYREILTETLTGYIQADPKNSEHDKAISAETEWLARSFVDPYYRDTPPNPPEKDKKKTLNHLVDMVKVDLNLMTRARGDNQAVAKLYTHYFCQHAKAVILTNENRTPPAVMNLTRALASLAVLGQGELADTLADLIAEDLKKDTLPESERLKNILNQPNDGLKYYALRGLQKLLEQTPKPPAETILTKEQEAKVVKVVQQLINANQIFRDGTPQEEIDGFRVRRREAIKVLALLANPAVPDKKDGVAMTLLRVVARDPKFDPPPTMDERVEAAIGLARMKFENVKDYDPDYATYHLGMFLDEFVAFCNTDNQAYQRPVRIYASRLIEALESMRAQLDDPVIKRTTAEKQFVTDALKQYYGEVLTRLEKGTDGRINPTTYKLNGWLATAKPPNMTLFKGVEGTSVDVPKKKG